jgi:uncharacterized protein
MYMYFDPLYILFSIPALLVSLFATLLLKVWTSKYMDTPNSHNTTGLDTLRKIAVDYDLELSISQADGYLNDHFDPRTNVIALSQEVANRPTIASVAITAHELGHALQSKQKSPLILIRSFIVPTVSIGTNVGYILIVLGFIISLTNLVWVGIAMFSLSTFFSLLTLPIEIDASTKAIKMIKKEDLLDREELSGAKKVLLAASLTYVAATISSLSNLAYFIFRAKRIGSRD